MAWRAGGSQALLPLLLLLAACSCARAQTSAPPKRPCSWQTLLLRIWPRLPSSTGARISRWLCPQMALLGPSPRGPTLTLHLNMIITGASIVPFNGVQQFAAASSLAGAFSIILGNGSVQILSSSQARGCPLGAGCEVEPRPAPADAAALSPACAVHACAGPTIKPPLCGLRQPVPLPTITECCTAS